MRLASSLYGGGTDDVTEESHVVVDKVYACDCGKMVHDRRETTCHKKDHGIIRGDLAKGKLF